MTRRQRARCVAGLNQPCLIQLSNVNATVPGSGPPQMLEADANARLKLGDPLPQSLAPSHSGLLVYGAAQVGH